MIEHEVPWHEELTCTVCGRIFWGDCAFREHVPCGKTVTRGKYRRYRNEKTGVVLFVLRGDKQHYEAMQARAAKARKGKRK